VRAAGPDDRERRIGTTLQEERTMSEPQTFTFADDGAIPNSRLPLLVYRRALPADPRAIEAHFAANRWPPAWRNSVHPFQHFHSNVHEALGCARGRGKVQFGGPNGPAVEIEAGDVVVLPAGVGHCRLERSEDFLIVGAYPENAAKPDQYRGDPAQHDGAVRNIARVPTPGADPVSGPDGALVTLWA
jgi:uncharacterized protein YjlB